MFYYLTHTSNNARLSKNEKILLDSILVLAKILNMFTYEKTKRLNEAKKIAKMLKALSSPIRLLIVCLLVDREKNVSELINEIGTTMGNISQHLRVLENSSILISRKDGNKVFYSIKHRSIIKFIEGIKQLCEGR
ncbi:MAG: metalloregulator ArsR/SmtB family transcription factor [Deltaproteobacteria bacterium]|nr:metalloregulator ArsR/SmtB family transcription factor [Deltaproteobacteria bacterium]